MKKTYCFVPEGNLPLHDIMLAQKIALETDELTALGVANTGDWPAFYLRPDGIINRDLGT